MTRILVLAGGVLDLELPRDYDLYVGVAFMEYKI